MATGTPTIINGQLVSGPAAPATPAPPTTLQVTYNFAYSLLQPQLV